MINRRELLKLTAGAPLLRMIPPASTYDDNNGTQSKQNILIVVFDALSALNMSAYQYHRMTMPLLERFLSKSTVYHNHYSSAPFTTPGTASLLTGTYSHTHRAIHLWGQAKASFSEKNIFKLFTDHYRLAYTHNPLADRLLDQFMGIDWHIPRQKLYLNNDPITGWLFSRDYNRAASSRRQILSASDGNAYSLFFPNLQTHYVDWLNKKYHDQFPRGLTISEANYVIILDDAISWLSNSAGDFKTPFLGYFHFWPPHSPYRTRFDFIDAFLDDGFVPDKKPNHPLSQGESKFMSDLKRRHYDEFLLYVDSEFGRLCDHLEKQGLLENTWLIFTSDHGEMFERGFFGHTAPSLHQPVLRIPLIISAPGQSSRQDIYSITSSVDVMPTLLHISGHPIPEWVEGQLLPPFSSNDSTAHRSIYAMMAKDNPTETGPLSTVSATVINNGHKLTQYIGYEALQGKQLIELYDLNNDYDELHDLSASNPELVNKLLDDIHKTILAGNPSASRSVN